MKLELSMTVTESDVNSAMMCGVNYHNAIVESCLFAKMMQLYFNTHRIKTFADETRIYFNAEAFELISTPESATFQHNAETSDIISEFDEAIEFYRTGYHEQMIDARRALIGRVAGFTIEGHDLEKLLDHISIEDLMTRQSTNENISLKTVGI